MTSTDIHLDRLSAIPDGTDISNLTHSIQGIDFLTDVRSHSHSDRRQLPHERSQRRSSRASSVPNASSPDSLAPLSIRFQSPITPSSFKLNLHSHHFYSTSSFTHNIPEWTFSLAVASARSRLAHQGRQSCLLAGACHFGIVPMTKEDAMCCDVSFSDGIVELELWKPIVR